MSNVRGMGKVWYRFALFRYCQHCIYIYIVYYIYNKYVKVKCHVVGLRYILCLLLVLIACRLIQRFGCMNCYGGSKSFFFFFSTGILWYEDSRWWLDSAAASEKWLPWLPSRVEGLQSGELCPGTVIISVCVAWIGLVGLDRRFQ